jgi:hypothetical protein
MPVYVAQLRVCSTISQQGQNALLDVYVPNLRTDWLSIYALSRYLRITLDMVSLQDYLDQRNIKRFARNP